MAPGAASEGGMIAPNCHSQGNNKHLELLSSKSIIQINQNALDSLN